MRVLHVDDSPEICQLYADMLATENHEVQSVNNGREGLDLVLKKDYDLILLDICMPKYSGMEFIHDLKAKRPSELKKVIIVSVLELSESHRNELLKLGIHSVEEKPSTIQKLETIKKDLLLRE
ncbi:MAG: response regulator [Nitrosopumilaceae archaeon]|jgi:DNA-binding response OmpR family regulator